MRYGMLIDLNYCVGCDACTIACKESQGTPPGILFSHVMHAETGSYPDAIVQHMPMLCMHCEQPACVDMCPTGASQKYDDGTVGVDHDLCIGCKTCMPACPYNARSYLSVGYDGYFSKYNLAATEDRVNAADFSEISLTTKFGFTLQEEQMYERFAGNKVYKCDFCASRRAEGLAPACVQACPAGARIFGDLEDPGSDVSKAVSERNAVRYREAEGTEPGVYYVPRVDFDGNIVQPIE